MPAWKRRPAAPDAPGGRPCRCRGGPARYAGRGLRCGQERKPWGPEHGKPATAGRRGGSAITLRSRTGGPVPIVGGPGFRPPGREAAGPHPAARSTALAARMTSSRPGRVWGLVASQAAGRGGRVSAADVCAAAVAAVEVTGAWLSAARGAEAGHLMRVTDEVGKQLAELHLPLGQGRAWMPLPRAARCWPRIWPAGNPGAAGRSCPGP
jgi:hypothetical protein